MDLMQVGKALSNGTRLKLLQLVADESVTAVRAHRRYGETYDEEIRRESIYRALEVLVDAQLLTKEYERDKGVVYRVTHEELLVDLRNAEATPVSAETVQDGQ